MAVRHRLYLVPGMFGFGRLAGYDYFHHVRSAIEQRFADAGIELCTSVVTTAPTSSLRHRARVLAKSVHRELPEEDGPIHLLGHSTGGLDARLLLSPSANLQIPTRTVDWTGRVRTCLSMNCPHYGTPLAGHFATVSGTRLLYALSLLTVISLTLGEPSLALASRLLSGLGDVESLLGNDGGLVGRSTDSLRRFVDREGREEIRKFLRKMRADQGGIIQIMPEAMDLFNAATEDRPGVRYGSVATVGPSPKPMRMMRRLWHPYGALTAAIYSTVYQFTSQAPSAYPYAVPSASQLRRFSWTTSEPISERSNDGIVPTLSMLWGDLIWCGEGDHLDVLGHFHDDQRPARHVDWMTSGALMDRGRFDSLMDAVSAFLLKQA
jgi:triacylglycerol lipase